VPGRFHVAINGRGYMVDTKFADPPFQIISIRSVRTQSDISNEPGEQSITPDDLWRRSQDSWEKGAGQLELDAALSDRRRFRSSKGIDIWTRGQISLLPDVAQKLTSTATNLRLLPVGSRLYVIDGTAVKYTTDITVSSPSWTSVTGLAGTPSSMTTDGFNIWIVNGTDIYKTDTGTSSASLWSTQDADIIGYVKNRLLIGKANALSYASDIAAPTFTTLFTHNSSSFQWVGFAEGPSNIYAAGRSGDRSLIYRIGIVAEGTSLSAPTVAAQLPDGEAVHAIAGYLGFIFLGTSRGVRFCTPQASGDLTIGEALPTPLPVRCFEGQGEFVWYGWSAYDGTSTGLGRLSLRSFSDIEALRPVYASDLMATGSAEVLSVGTFQDRRVFTVNTLGVFAEDTQKVLSGTIDTGLLNYGITEPKVALFLETAYGADGKVESWLAADDGAFVRVGTRTAGSVSSYATSAITAARFEIRHILFRNADNVSGPILTRWTLRSEPIPRPRKRIILPILLFERVMTAEGGESAMNPGEEWDILETAREDKTPIALQIGEQNFSALVEDLDFFPYQPTRDRTFWNGTAVITAKTL
jgi:hypothetical protein